MLVCPYGALAPGEDGVMQKCELCLQNTCGEPACVRECPNRAIVYEQRGKIYETVCHYWKRSSRRRRIEGIRSVDTGGSIAVVSEEKRPVYCRPLISYYLEGKTDLDKMNYRAPDFYEKTGCKVLYGQRAVRIDNKAKTVILDNGSTHPL